MTPAPSPRVLILRAAGTNCDLETALAFRLAGADVETIHAGLLLRRERRLDEFHILAIPGGFSYGDDLGAGTILANQLRSHLARDLDAFVESGRLVLGICNGFQVLVRLGLLPGWKGEKAVSLVENSSGKFEDRWVHLRVETDRCPFLAGEGGVAGSASRPPLPEVPMEPSRPPPESSSVHRQPPAASRQPLLSLRLPVAHKEGRFLVRDAGVLERLREGDQVALRYIDSEAGGGAGTTDYPQNPNGSVDAIAGIINPQGNVLGLMPHPERHRRRLHDPLWTRKSGAVVGCSLADEERGGAGFSLFENAVGHARRRWLES